MDVDAILASLETGRAGVLEQWLEENPERTGKFWTMYGRMMDSFDHHGHLDSKTYDVG